MTDQQGHHQQMSQQGGSNEQQNVTPNANQSGHQESFSEQNGSQQNGTSGQAHGNGNGQQSDQNHYVQENVFHITKGYSGPKFYPEKIYIWFIRFELFLASNRYTGDKTKFSQLAQAIDTETLALTFS